MNTRKETAKMLLAIAALLLVFGLAGGQDRAGEQAEAQANAAAVHRAGR